MASSGLAKPVIGLIGAPGSGKSTVAALLADKGGMVIDADELARQAIEDPQIITQLTQWWGKDILDPQGRVDRKAISAIVFADHKALHRLESLIHPMVHHERQRLRQQALHDPCVAWIIEDCPLLLETGLDQHCDAVVYIDTARPLRLARVQASRQWNESELLRREKRQISCEIKEKRADWVIDNSGDLAHLEAQVNKCLRFCIEQLHDVDGRR